VRFVGFGESVINNAWNEQREVVFRAWVNILTVILATFIAICLDRLVKDPIGRSHYSHELS
jgi:hypothetical protein